MAADSNEPQLAQHATQTATDGPQITAGEIRRRWEQSNRTIARELREFEIAKSFLANEQWISWNKQTRSVTNVPRDPTRVRRTNNRLTPSTRTIMAKLLRRALVFEVPPMGNDDATIQGARSAAAVLHHTHREHKWEELREQQAMSAWQGGTGLIAVDWDPRAGTHLGVNPETGREFGTGDIVCSVLTIAEAATVPGARDIERARWWVRAAALPPDEVKDLYRLDTTPAADVQGQVKPLQTQGDDDRAGDTKADLTLVLHYYERPFGKNRGQVAVVVGNKIVDGPHPWPFPFTDRLNVIAARDIKVLNRWCGDAILWTAIPQQSGLNMAESSIAEHMRLAANARIKVPAGSLDDLDTFTDEPGEAVEYVPIGGQSPEWMAPPSMPAWWQNEPERLQRDIDDVLGVHDISRGEAPSGVDSGVALNLLAEQDDTPVGKFARELADAWARYASLVLKIYEAKVTETREARLDVPGQAPESKQWTGQSFQGQTEAVVPFDAVSPMSRTAAFSRAKTLWDAKIVTDPKQFARMAELAGADDFTEGLDPDVAKARRENHRLAIGDPVIPAEFDNHASHIAEHNRFRKAPKYEELDDKTRELVDMHVQAHATVAAQEAAQAVAKAQVSPALAGAAQAHEPPPAQLPPHLGLDGAPVKGMPQVAGGPPPVAATDGQDEPGAV